MNTQEFDTPRDGAIVPSQGIEWSLIGLGAAILTLIFLFLSVIGSRSHSEPQYDGLRPLSSQQQAEQEAGPTYDIGTRSEADSR